MFKYLTVVLRLGNGTVINSQRLLLQQQTTMQILARLDVIFVLNRSVTEHQQNVAQTIAPLGAGLPGKWAFDKIEKINDQNITFHK